MVTVDCDYLMKSARECQQAVTHELFDKLQRSVMVLGEGCPAVKSGDKEWGRQLTELEAVLKLSGDDSTGYCCS